MFEEFYINNKERHIKSISKALKYNKHLAEDIVQQAYLQAFDKFYTYDEKKGKIGPWFNKILYNTLKDYQRKFGDTVSITDNIPIEDGSLEYLIAVEKELSYVKNARHVNILRQFYIRGYTAKEVNRLTGYSITNIETICGRFRKQLKERYGGLI